MIRVLFKIMFFIFNSEFISEESNEKFWQFLETVQELAIYKQTGR